MGSAPPSDSESSASSQSLLSRHLFATSNKVTALETQVRNLSDTVAFQEDKINNLEHQHRSLELSVRQLQASHDGLSQQVLALEAELQAARNVLTFRGAEAVTQGVAIARVSRRVEAVERVLSLHGLD